jgi:hypothetical protein
MRCRTAVLDRSCCFLQHSSAALPCYLMSFNKGWALMRQAASQLPWVSADQQHSPECSAAKLRNTLAAPSERRGAALGADRSNPYGPVARACAQAAGDSS